MSKITTLVLEWHDEADSARRTRAAAEFISAQGVPYGLSEVTAVLDSVTEVKFVDGVEQ